MRKNEKQNILKSAANESLGTVKRRNRRKYLKLWDDQIKQKTKKKTHYVIEFKVTRRQTVEYKRNTALCKREVRRRRRLSRDILLQI